MRLPSIRLWIDWNRALYEAQVGDINKAPTFDFPPTKLSASQIPKTWAPSASRIRRPRFPVPIEHGSHTCPARALFDGAAAAVKSSHVPFCIAADGHRSERRVAEHVDHSRAKIFAVLIEQRRFHFSPPAGVPTERRSFSLWQMPSTPVIAAAKMPRCPNKATTIYWPTKTPTNN